MKYRSIFISDIHLGTRGCQAKSLEKWLKKVECENLYLVGDIIDGWRLKKKWFWPPSHSEVVRRVLKISKTSQVYWVLGNHDEGLRPFLEFEMKFGNLKVVDEVIHIGVDEKRYLVVHGDYFDGITRMAPWLVFLGDKAYNFSILLNRWYNKVRRWLGFDYWSVSQFLKRRVKKGVDFIWKFKDSITEYAKKQNLDGVICGHLHTPEITTHNNILYMNDGDWVESCSALVEHYSGDFELVFLRRDDD